MEDKKKGVTENEGVRGDSAMKIAANQAHVSEPMHDEQFFHSFP